MQIEFDEAKDLRNIRERGISLARFEEMEPVTTAVSEDARTDYGERRLRLIGHIDGRLHVAVITYRSSAPMRKRPSRPDTENPEWTDEDFRKARPALEVLPKELLETMGRYRGQRGPQKAPTKVQISLRVDRDVVATLRATGRGWQTRANEALRASVTKTGAGDGRLSRGRTASRRTVTSRKP